MEQEHIPELMQTRADVAEKIQALASLEKENGALTEQEVEQFTRLETEFTSLTQRIERQQAADRIQGELAQPVQQYNKAPDVIVKEPAEQYKGAGAVRMLMSVAAGGGDAAEAIKFAREDIRDQGVAMAIETSAGSGGALIPRNFHKEVIELLRGETIARRLGARTVPLPNGNMTMPRQNGGASATYTGESQNIVISESTFGDMELQAKKLTSMVPMSNELIGYAGYDVEQLVLTDMLDTMSEREDKAVLRDDGTGKTPTGFKKMAEDHGVVVPFSGGHTLEEIDAYLDLLILRFKQSHSRKRKPGWGMTCRTFTFLFGLRNPLGLKVYPEMAQGQLKGMPVLDTTMLPDNLGAGSNEAEIYLTDWSDVLIAETGVMKVDFSREASYIDGSGQLVSAYSKDQSLIRVITSHDIGFRHPKSLILGNKVTF